MRKKLFLHHIFFEGFADIKGTFIFSREKDENHRTKAAGFRAGAGI